MKSFKLILFLTLIAFSFTGCEVIGTIFEAGVWVGIILVVLVVLIIGWIIRRFMR